MSKVSSVASHAVEEIKGSSQRWGSSLEGGNNMNMLYENFSIQLFHDGIFTYQKPATSGMNE
jgi:hypothetical protein